jgi:hypothetical protein
MKISANYFCLSELLLEFPQNNPQDRKIQFYLSQDLKKREKYKESLSLL